MKERIQQLAQKYQNDLLRIRHHLHAYPELSFEEYETAAFIAEELKKLNISFEQGVAGTGIVATISGKNSSDKVVALRADMDALPVQELNKVAYCSKNPGVMHACGHDVHTTCILGAAMILQEVKDELKHNVRLIFQPGEEKLPGGASLMIKAGVLENPRPESIIGEHVFPELVTGKVGFRSGMYMASTDEIYLVVKGKGGHAALPHQYNNPIFATSAILLELQKFFMDENTREVPEEIPTVLAFGRVIADGATNVVPDEVKVEGTFRTMNEEWRDIAHTKIRHIVQTVAARYQVSAELLIARGYPFLVNDESVTAKWRTAAEEYLGKENVVELDIRMTAEDFAWYSQEIPSCFYRLGTRNEAKGITSSVHTATFDIDEEALTIGAGLMAYATLRY